MKKVFLGLGSNLGDRAENLHEAKIRIGESIGKIVSESSVYETEPWGFESKDEFLNMVLCIETDLSPSGLLGRILMIESQLGRVRYETRNASRNIDVDILMYNDEIIDGTSLQIPHPRMHDRRFVMAPLSEIAPDIIHPVLKKSMKDLLESCPDTGKFRLYKANNCL